MLSPNKKRLQRDPNPLECAKEDLHLLKICGMPSEDVSRYITLSVILGDLVRYHEDGGFQGGSIRNVTPTTDGFLRVINEFIPIVGFPSDSAAALELAVADNDGIGVALACRKASETLQGWAAELERTNHTGG